MSWFMALLFAGGLVAVGRIYYGIRKMREQRVKDWDEIQIDRLRKQGSDPFQPHDVDFFMAMPSEAAGLAVKAKLEADGFTVDLKPAPDNPSTQPFSLHATQSLRLSLPGMRELSATFKALAKESGGQYDGWSAARVARRDSVLPPR
jgi:hypothetical protein